MSTQHNYRIHEHETLVVLEALMKWEDKLLGRKFTVVTNHKGLEYFKTQPNLSLRQTRWWVYFSHFNDNTIHVDGTQSQVADSLSCYYEYDTIEDEYPDSEFVKVDEILDLEGDLAPVQQFVEIRNHAIRRSQRLQERTPTARLESQMLNETFNNIPVEQETEDEDTIVYTAGSNGKPLLASIEKEFDLNQLIMKFYQQEKIYSKILENPKAHAKFGVKEGLIFTKNNLSRDVICVSPKAIHKGK